MNPSGDLTHFVYNGFLIIEPLNTTSAYYGVYGWTWPIEDYLQIIETLSIPMQIDDCGRVATNWTNTYKNENGQWSSVGTTISGPANWHTYTAYLTRIGTTNNVSIEYWIDGSKVSTQTGQSFFNEPLNLIIDLQMEGSSGTPGPAGNTVMSARNVTIQRSATL